MVLGSRVVSIPTKGKQSPMGDLVELITQASIWDFPKIRVPCFGVLIIRILLFRVQNKAPLFSELPHILHKNLPCGGQRRTPET